jgi:hypothetical protein
LYCSPQSLTILMNTNKMMSNLSKIKTKFRTQGNVTGNFGVPKAKAGSSLNDIGMTKVKVVKCTTQSQYLDRLYHAFDYTTDAQLRKFLYQEIRSIHIQNNNW